MARILVGLHRWVGLAIGLQLLAWTAGGLVFATHALDWVRGERTRSVQPSALPLDSVRASPAEAARVAGVERPEEILLRRLLDEPVYEVRGGTSGPVLVSASTGRKLPALDRLAATRVALADQRGPPEARSVELFTSSPPPEYRERPLPAWRVILDDEEETHVWVDATTGTVAARRNRAWRRFDFFWMLHTMDYAGRDSFNHPLLIAAAVAGLLSILSGWALWGWRVWRRLARSGRASSEPAAE